MIPFQTAETKAGIISNDPIILQVLQQINCF